MPPKGSSNSKTVFSNPLQTQADDAKYKSKYKQLKLKLQEVEEDNTKLSLRVLKSKKSIQRLRIERAILYDRLQRTTTPTNPYALRTSKHLSQLANANTTGDSSSSSSSVPPGNGPSTILDTVSTSYPLKDPQGPDSSFLRPMDRHKLAALVQNDRGEPGKEWGERPEVGLGERGVSPLTEEEKVKDGEREAEG